MSADLEDALLELRDTRTALAERDEAAFDRMLAALRVWQAEGVAALHADLADRYEGQRLLRFLTRSFYLEGDWTELTGRPDRIAGQVGRIINDDRPLVIAVRLQHAADTMDAELTDALLARNGEAPITPAAYVRAFRDVGRIEQREQQIAWINELVDLLGGYADNRAAYWAFKLAGSPAKALGLGHTYALLAEGFAAMRTTRDLEAATRTATARQRAILYRLLGAHR